MKINTESVATAQAAAAADMVGVGVTAAAAEEEEDIAMIRGIRQRALHTSSETALYIVIFIHPPSATLSSVASVAAPLSPQE